MYLETLKLVAWAVYTESESGIMGIGPQFLDEAHEKLGQATDHLEVYQWLPDHLHYKLDNYVGIWDKAPETAGTEAVRPEPGDGARQLQPLEPAPSTRELQSITSRDVASLDAVLGPPGGSTPEPGSGGETPAPAEPAPDEDPPAPPPEVVPAATKGGKREGTRGRSAA